MRKASPLLPGTTRHTRTAAELKKLRKERAQWMAGLHPDHLFHKLFDHIPGVFFFAKDRAGRTMYVSRGILDLYQMHDESEMLGLTDHDLNPPFMAENAVRDDTLLLSGSAKKLERIELWFDRLGMPDWFMVTKLPLHGAGRRPEGVMGILRRASDTERQLPLFQTVAKAVQIMRTNFASPLHMSAVARACGQSLRQLQRHFHAAFAAPPQEILLRTRLREACRMLEETRMGAAEIAQACGFTDPSAFAHHFRKRVGLTPTLYRKRLAPASPPHPRTTPPRPPHQHP